ncbi:MAG: helix-turn-helix domain-containing protein [Bacillota bacterium]|nr:helix-turn-helix domain-containing protein [Bacillota bacterium]
MKKYTWPGNVRELKNVVERLAILSNGDLITEEDVQGVFSKINGTVKDIHPDSMNHLDWEVNSSIAEEYSSYEKVRILEALKKAGGNKTKAAEILGITRTKLYRKLKDL